MEQIFLAVQHPVIQFAPLAFPMICVNNSKLLHRVMTDPFRKFLGRTLPVALAISILVALFHSWSYAMSAVILAPYIQWIGLYGLYQRFIRAHGRHSRVSVELAALGGSANDHVFRIVSSMTTVGLPLAVFLLLTKILSGGGPNYFG